MALNLLFVTTEVATAAAAALSPLEADSSYILDRFRQADQLEALRYIEGNAANELTR